MKTITHIIITHAVFLILFAGAAIAFAQDNVPAAPPIPTNAVGSSVQLDRPNAGNAQEQVQERRAEMQQNVAERRTQLQARAQERIANLAANMSNRFDAATARFENIIGRMDSRIEKLQELGVDTTEAEAALASAKLSVEAVKGEIADIDEAVNDAVGAEDVRIAWASVKGTFLASRDHLKTAHTELRACVAALKVAVAASGSGNGVSNAVRNELRAGTETGTETVED